MLERNKQKKYQFETLEERSVLAASAFAALAKTAPAAAASAKAGPATPAAFAPPQAGGANAALPSFGTALRGSAPVGAQVGTETRLATTLTDSTGTNTAVGFASYVTKTVNGVTTKQFDVTVSGAVAGAKLTVNVGGVDVGTITVNDNGTGSLSFSTNPKTGQTTFPANFPTTVDATTAVKIGTDLNGTLATVSRGPCGPGAPGAGTGTTVTDVTRVAASLSDSTGTSTLKANVSYNSATVNGTVMSAFRVCVSGGTAGQVVNVTVSSTDATTGAVTTTTVGTITLDANGRGQLLYTTNPGSKGIGVAFPANFPTSITAGLTVGVDTLTATLATVSGRPKR
jgi:hypothetical protein